MNNAATKMNEEAKKQHRRRIGSDSTSQRTLHNSKLVSFLLAFVFPFSFNCDAMATSAKSKLKSNELKSDDAEAIMKFGGNAVFFLFSCLGRLLSSCFCIALRSE